MDRKALERAKEIQEELHALEKAFNALEHPLGISGAKEEIQKRIIKLKNEFAGL